MKKDLLGGGNNNNSNNNNNKLEGHSVEYRCKKNVHIKIKNVQKRKK